MRTSKFKFRKNKKDLAKVDAAPMTDVIFLLLIFFMISSSFVMLPSIKLKLPQTSINESVEDKKIIVSIDKKNNIFINDQKVEEKNLLNVLPSYLRENKDISVMIKADKRVSHGMVVRIMDKSRQSGAKKLLIATEPKRR